LSDVSGNEFRKQAEDARQMASRALKQEDKVFWLRMAEDRQKLAAEADEQPKQR
jgi:hypothetical protein